ncbi:GGDEF domain-containing protein [Oribacterium sp. NK2B42]|uniref:GGDEF domain-containing protein n=1 Tax=Oribacterium sp. NK2B42 TaxID=689781 RepID=UPI0004929EB5|nr:GGDEF domain-containing protein [Oribacterium sp. NK2B42]
MGYYTAVIYLSCATLLMFARMIHDNQQIDIDTRKRFSVSYLVIIVAMLAEWGGVALNGAPAWTIPLHVLMKAIDYIVTPYLGLRLVEIVMPKSRLLNYLRLLIASNSIAEIISAFNGSIYYVDSQNVYHHGAFYSVYVMVFVSALVSVLWAYLKVLRDSSNTYGRSTISIVLMVAAGIGLQVFFGNEMRTICLAITYGTMLLFVQYQEYYLRKNEIDLSEKQKLLETDVMTGLKSRFAYSNVLDKYESLDKLPDNLTAVVFDVNGLKRINDSLGHKAGDELVQGAGECLKKAFSDYGECYHISGDEFVALLEVDPDYLNEAMVGFNDIVASWRGEHIDSISVSAGYAVAKDNPGNINNLISIADAMMYENKRSYYSKKENCRRKNTG